VASNGGKALLIPLGASSALGCIGYARAFGEIADQLPGGGPATIVVPSSSGGTLAGLVLGMALRGTPWPVLGVSADDPADVVRSRAVSLAYGAASFPELGPLSEETIETVSGGVRVTDAHVGDGYGIPTPEGDAAKELFARKAGIILDPVYTAKAGAALIHETHGLGPVVFIHTGGHPALFR